MEYSLLNVGSMGLLPRSSGAVEAEASLALGKGKPSLLLA